MYSAESQTRLNCMFRADATSRVSRYIKYFVSIFHDVTLSYLSLGHVPGVPFVTGYLRDSARADFTYFVHALERFSKNNNFFFTYR